ncbi:hypothetical protein [Maricaulis sp.]|uniref:hypothetical protein n=1 Tax=Maricaulis sp. TaxID=1486257 RepID=UPI002B2723A7|nr:hypothetical protein [Maricaulis sp.]
MADLITYVLAIIGVMGCVLTLVGIAMPRLAAADGIEIRWADASAESLFRIPVTAVQNFIDSTRNASEGTAARARSFQSVAWIVISVFGTGYLIFRIGYGSEAVWDHMVPLIVIVGLGVLALFLNQVFARNLHRLIERVRLDTRHAGFVRHLGFLERRKERVDSFAARGDLDADGRNYINAERRTLRRRKQDTQARIELAERRQNELGDVPTLVASSRAGTFRVFVVTSMVVGALGWLWWQSYLPLVAGVFDIPIMDALQTIVLMIPILLFMFLFLQTLIPTTQILSSNELSDQDETADPLNQTSVFLFLLGICLSLALTFSALALGSFLEPMAPLPQMLQLVVCNAIFDGLTLMLTIRVLQFATRGAFRRGSSDIVASLKVLVAIVVDIGIAAGLAFLSLYIGLFGSEFQVSAVEALRVLVGQAPNGEGLEFGPYFWVMHTAFIPTAMYLLGLVLLILMKLIATVFYNVFSGRFGRAIPATGTLLMTVSAMGGYLLYLGDRHHWFGGG